MNDWRFLALNEEWRPVPNTAGLYSVSSMGRVRRNPGRLPGMLIRPPISSGYRRFKPGGTRKLLSVARCVATVFLGPPEPDRQVNHKNGVKIDDRPANLEWCTAAENVRHADRVLGHGHLLRKGTQHLLAKLDEPTISEIVRLREADVSQGRIAKLLGMNIDTIECLCKGATWKHLAVRPLRGKIGMARGTAHGLAKLTVAKVTEMRALAASGVGYTELSRRYGVNDKTVRAAVTRLTWRHVP